MYLFRIILIMFPMVSSADIKLIENDTAKLLSRTELLFEDHDNYLWNIKIYKDIENGDCLASNLNEYCKLVSLYLIISEPDLDPQVWGYRLPNEFDWKLSNIEVNKKDMELYFNLRKVTVCKNKKTEVQQKYIFNQGKELLKLKSE